MVVSSGSEFTHSVGYAQHHNELTVSQQIEQLLETESAFTGAIAGISVRSSSTGELIYHHNGDIRLRPASNLKLVTAAVALSTLGEQHQFNTELATNGNVNSGVLDGNLYVVGKGDPTLLISDLEKMIKELKNQGITKIQGDLIGDDSWFDDVRLSKDLPWSDETTYYGAQISALTLSPDEDYDSGTVIVEIKPSEKIGEPPTVNILPKNTYLTIENKAKTTKSDQPKNLEIFRKHGENTIVITGEIPQNGVRLKKWISVWEPTLLVTHMVKEVLNKNGITLTGNVKAGKTPEQVTVLTTHSSMVLSQLLIPFLKLSNNGHGEVLVKEMGRVVKDEGSWEKGLEVVEQQLARWELNPSAMVLRDGSGISHVNLISANELSKLLYHVQDEEWYDSFLNALPIASSSDRLLAGTLIHRLDNISDKALVRAKTGTLTTVSSLSGYIHTENGDSVVFSILLNNLIDEDEGKKLEDKIVEVLTK
ncbi:D-alanyl-D-alanine carboxypeptidase/D-alanyl-D-alanine-endopeptidase (penicillin-binding protein 4) [Bacillus mesophilus]|uniref:D-alanyl-D-alanine carboxypeptidase/D-alanyl-D-alanine-endopeptidase n=1 Tax=Bacillus mesophilus TaxID=1808955 RepID=A0A6M0Q8L0_9BACI|nr:D-alanyl-D-alanine carboxypeptidase/D-alanyl-D-alanine-endopeptidase [Bacillus mesophilus]MBM7661946.1 D-alanyl-D-alanine carboxypeptidase/D-alanyl-D-alanine-endopeptidase (penicillin-binding protein 4) [Bacillus mesophilus]NEY72695.1 D-alanyl-D-alanine carboxypeptidase/D-alanyl-D-alanine-endopeptidase [Bacillus mesophilus]